MTDSDRPSSNRREFLSGGGLRKEVEWVGEQVADQLDSSTETRVPSSGPSIRLGTTAMATDFVIMMNPGPPAQVMVASEVLEEIHQLEQEMTIHKEEGELFQLNRDATSGEPQEVSARLGDVIKQSLHVAAETAGAYDPTSGPLIDVWKIARQEGRIPTPDELQEALSKTGYSHVMCDENSSNITIHRKGLGLNLGGIGKGFALDCLGHQFQQREQEHWLIHGGKSSLLAAGSHHNVDGWPVGVKNPLFPKERLATIVLRNRGMSTSGAGIQFFRHEGKRYGHILDPRSGQPAENMLSVTVLAPSAAEADALSTAFFVMGLEKAREYCDNHVEIGALLIPPPQTGRRLKVHTFNLPERTLFLRDEVIHKST